MKWGKPHSWFVWILLHWIFGFFQLLFLGFSWCTLITFYVSWKADYFLWLLKMLPKSLYRKVGKMPAKADHRSPGRQGSILCDIICELLCRGWKEKDSLLLLFLLGILQHHFSDWFPRFQWKWKQQFNHKTFNQVCLYNKYWSKWVPQTLCECKEDHPLRRL